MRRSMRLAGSLAVLLTIAAIVALLAMLPRGEWEAAAGPPNPHEWTLKAHQRDDGVWVAEKVRNPRHTGPDCPVCREMRKRRFVKDEP